MINMNEIQHDTCKKGVTMSLHVVIGTAPCSWGVWWPDGTPSGTPWNVFLDQAAAAGYSALELGPVGYLPTDLEQLKDELALRKLSICGGTACFEFLKADSFQDVHAQVDDICKRVVALGAKQLMTMDACPMDRAKKAQLGDAYEKVYDIFGEMGKYCRDTYGVQVLMHPERCSLIETRQDLINLIDRGLDICFDNGHYVAANGSWEKNDQSSLNFYREFHEKIPYLHFKNVSSDIRHKEMTGEIPQGDARLDDDLMCLLEDGIINYEQFRDLLDQYNFDGVGIIEQDCPHADTDTAFAMAKTNLQYLQKIHMI